MTCVATTFSAGCYFSACELFGLKYRYREQYLMLIMSEVRELQGMGSMAWPYWAYFMKKGD